MRALLLCAAAVVLAPYFLCWVCRVHSSLVLSRPEMHHLISVGLSTTYSRSNKTHCPDLLWSVLSPFILFWCVCYSVLCCLLSFSSTVFFLISFCYLCPGIPCSGFIHWQFFESIYSFFLHLLRSLIASFESFLSSWNILVNNISLKPITVSNLCQTPCLHQLSPVAILILHIFIFK